MDPGLRNDDENKTFSQNKKLLQLPDEIIIYWSNEDNVYIADVPELPSCMAHGNTYFEALKNIGDAIDLWLETAEINELPIPTPKGRRLMFA